MTLEDRLKAKQVTSKRREREACERIARRAEEKAIRAQRKLEWEAEQARAKQAIREYNGTGSRIMTPKGMEQLARNQTTKLIREEQNEAYRQERARAAIIAKAMKEADAENYRRDVRAKSHRHCNEEADTASMNAAGGDK